MKKAPPDVFRWEKVEVGDPGENEVRIRNNAIGVNYVDIYHRRGVPHPWPMPPLPVVLGFEGVGDIVVVGPGVTGFKEGDRSATRCLRTALMPRSAYIRPASS